MKKLYLVDTNATREFWTVEMLPEGDPEVVAVLRSLYSNESVDARDASEVEDDSSWENVVALTAEELENLFDNVKILDERNF